MKKITIRNGLIATLALLSLVALPVTASVHTAHAEKEKETETEETSTTQEDRTTAIETEKKSTTQEDRTKADEKKEEVKTRLAETKLKVCQTREKVITNIMSRVSTRGQKQVDLFTKIADRTKAFYVEKGKTLSNYDSLVANVNSKKTAAQSAVDAVKSTSTEFKCDGTDPKGVAATFKGGLKAQDEALKAYKTAVKDLIVGVKSVQSPEGDNQ